MSSATPRSRRRRYLPAAVAALVVILIPVCLASWHAVATRHDRRALRLLQSGDPDAQRLGAWIASTEQAPRAIQLIAQDLVRQRDPDIREHYVHALGRQGGPEHLDLIARVVREDHSAYVRQAAWVATARLDAARFRALAAEVEERSEAWDQIGRAYAWLEVADVRGVDVLLHWAVEGTTAQRGRAAQALYRGVAPLLEAVGRWPSGAQVEEGDPWPAELVADVRRRCAELDLQQITNDTWPHAVRGKDLRRHAGKVQRARERLAKLLSQP